ncbi:MAG: hypothetical protein WEB00_00465 [Dehalococcoidia bacterium]
MAPLSEGTLSKGRRRRQRIEAQGGPKAPPPPRAKKKAQSGFPWPDWLQMPVAGAFGIGIVVAGSLLPVIALGLIPLVVLLAFLPWTRWLTPAMAAAYCVGVGLLLVLRPTGLGVVVSLAALVLLGIVSGHYFSTRVVRPILDRRQGGA